MKVFLASLPSRLRGLNAESDNVAAEALAENSRRLPWLMSFVLILLVLGGLGAWYGTPMTAAAVRYRTASGWVNLATAAWVGLMGVVYALGKRSDAWPKWGSVFILVLGSSLVAYTGVTSVIEQWWRSSVTIFMLGCVSMGAGFLIPPRTAALQYTLIGGVFIYALGLTQHDPAMLQADRFLGLVAAAMGWVLSYVQWRRYATLVQMQRQLEALAQRDALTGLFNRREFAKLANVELLRARRSASDTSIIMADLDHFKRVNDTFGHPAGDEVIKFMANALLQGVRQTDVVARMGGEEFIVLLPETALEAARDVAEKLRAWLQATPVPIDASQVIPVTGSFGVAALGKDQKATLEALYAAADAALYAAKTNGRNRVEAVAVDASP